MCQEALQVEATPRPGNCRETSYASIRTCLHCSVATYINLTTTRTLPVKHFGVRQKVYHCSFIRRTVPRAFGRGGEVVADVSVTVPGTCGTK